MTLRATILFSSLLFVACAIGQTCTLTGKVIDDQFFPVYQAKIFNADTTFLVETDIKGNFNIDIPSDTQVLIVAWVSMEWKSIKLSGDCNNLEIILLPRGTYDFMSPRKVDRQRKKQFDKLPALHQTAFKKGIFEANKPCYVEKFISFRKSLKEMRKIRTQMPST